MEPIKMEFKSVKRYIPQICESAVRVSDHYECPSGCTQIHVEEKYICPCFGKNWGGWIPSDADELIQQVKDFNASRERLYPMIDEYNFEGLEHFRPHKFQLLIEYVDSSNKEKVKAELHNLLDNGDKVGYNYDWGVGNIVKEDDGTYSVKSWRYQARTVSVDHGNLDDVLDFIEEIQGGGCY